MNKKPTLNALRQAAFVDRMAAAGYLPVRGLYAHQTVHAQIKRYAAKLAKARGDDPRDKT